MSNPYVGEIRMFAGNFAPAGWAICDGSLLSIAENDVLFNLIGTTYGGDGQNTFALPDLRSRVPLNMGQGPGLANYIIGQPGGQEAVTLTTNQIPLHNHSPQANSGSGTSTNPAGNVWAGSSDIAQFNPSPNTMMNPGVIGNTGGNQPHDNMLPFLSVNFIISLFGIYPSPA